jgi:hypothetical protein
MEGNNRFNFWDSKKKQLNYAHSNFQFMSISNRKQSESSDININNCSTKSD